MDKKALTTRLKELGHEEWLAVLTWVAERFNGIDLADISTDPSHPTLCNDLILIAENASRSAYPEITLTNQLSQLLYWSVRVSKQERGQTVYWSPLACNYGDFVGADAGRMSLQSTAYPATDIVRHRLRQIVNQARCVE